MAIITDATQLLSGGSNRPYEYAGGAVPLYPPLGGHIDLPGAAFFAMGYAPGPWEAGQRAWCPHCGSPVPPGAAAPYWSYPASLLGD